MRLRFATSLAIILACSSVWGQWTRARIDGPTVANVGDKIVMRVSADVPGAALVWLTAADVDYEEFDGGKAVGVWTKRPGRYDFTCVVVAVDAAGKLTTAKTTYRIEVTGVPPGPLPPGPIPPGPVPPGPTPPVPPVPPTPSSLGLREIGQAAPRDAMRAAVGVNYALVSGKIGAGVLKDVDAIDEEVYRLNRATFGLGPADRLPATSPWKPFFDATGAQLTKLEAAGKLVTAADYRVAYSEIAEGLK